MELQEKMVSFFYCLIRLFRTAGDFIMVFLPEREGKQRDLCLYEP